MANLEIRGRDFPFSRAAAKKRAVGLLNIWWWWWWWAEQFCTCCNWDRVLQSRTVCYLVSNRYNAQVSETFRRKYPLILLFLFFSEGSVSEDWCWKWNRFWGGFDSLFCVLICQNNDSVTSADIDLGIFPISLFLLICGAQGSQVERKIAYWLDTIYK